MRLAITTWNGRISPVFDVAKRLLLVELDRGAELGCHEVPIEEAEVAARASHVLSLGVDTLICGAISRPLEQILASAGVNVVPRTCGPVEEVLRAPPLRFHATERPSWLRCLGHMRKLLRISRGSTISRPLLPAGKRSWRCCGGAHVP
ncbi:MAG: NifB/NifX family molybdenum-iron cluster-binding protein [Phycisphaerae bacterium]|nr:NifB/NifX family molybdenum-iron cluster-binding protein [Phycisphaerae bacterium]